MDTEALTNALRNIEGVVAGHGIRIELLEKSTKDGETHRTHVFGELTRLDANVKNLAEQARYNNELQTKAINELKASVAESDRSTKEFVKNTVAELHKGQDLIIKCLGIDEDEAAAKEMRLAFQALRASWNDRKELTLWVKRGVITLILAGIATVAWAGVKALIVFG